MRFLVAAEESAGTRALTRLLHSAHTLVGVLTRDEAGRFGDNPVSELARSSGCRVWPARLVKEPATARLLQDEGVDILLNVYSLYQVAPEVIGAARVGAFNLHPGRLPQVAGRNPISAALYRGDAEHGVTLHHMTAGFDAGDIAFAITLPIQDDDTALTLARASVLAGEGLISALLEAAEEGRIPAVPQDLSQRTCYPGHMPEGGMLDFSRPAREVVNFVRAYDFMPFTSRWGHPRVMVGSTTIEIARARRTGRPCSAPAGSVGDASPDQVMVAAADEWVAVVTARTGDTYVPAHRLLTTGQIARR